MIGSRWGRKNCTMPEYSVMHHPFISAPVHSLRLSSRKFPSKSTTVSTSALLMLLRSSDFTWLQKSVHVVTDGLNRSLNTVMMVRSSLLDPSNRRLVSRIILEDWAILWLNEKTQMNKFFYFRFDEQVQRRNWTFTSSLARLQSEWLRQAPYAIVELKACSREDFWRQSSSTRGMLTDRE